MRLTKKKLLEWVNKEFEKMEIKEYMATEIYTTRYRQDDYEGGACYFHVYFNFKDESKRHDLIKPYFMCFYPLYYYQKEINNGNEIYLKLEGRSLRDLTIEIRKKTILE